MRLLKVLWTTVVVGIPLLPYQSNGFSEPNCDSFQYFNASLDASDEESLPVSIRDTFKKVSKILENIAELTGAPSLSFGVVYDQSLVFYKGYSSRSDQSHPTPDSIYRTGSINKVWTVLMAFAMRDSGFISFDDTITSLNPNFTVPNPWGITEDEKQGRTLTIRQLASQVSGLSREVPCAMDTGDCSSVDSNEIFRRLSTEALLHPTDVQPSYSNLAYAILGNVLSECLNGASYNDTIFDLVFKPLGLKHTGLYLNKEQKKYAMTGYENNEAVDYIDIGWGGPAGQAFSSVNDLSILMKQYFAAFPSVFQDRVDEKYPFAFAPQTLREMLRPMFLNPDGQTGFGSPWEMQRIGSHLVRSKGGNIYGFSSSFAMVPEMKLGVIALGNYDFNEAAYTFSALEILLPAFESWIKDEEAAFTLLPKAHNYKDYEGKYVAAGLHVEIYVDKVTGNLRAASSIPGIYGVLSWNGDEDAEGFVYHDLSMDMNSCFGVTLGGIDGMVIRFVRDDDGGVLGIELPAYFNARIPKEGPSSLKWLKETFIGDKAILYKQVTEGERTIKSSSLRN